MIRIDVIWLALGAADLRGGIDTLLAQVVRGFALGAQAHHAYVFANRRADRLKVLVYDGAGMWLCTRRLQAGSFAWPRQDTGSLQLTREQFDWLVAGLPWQRLGSVSPRETTRVHPSKRSKDPCHATDPMAHRRRALH